MLDGDRGQMGKVGYPIEEVPIARQIVASLRNPCRYGHGVVDRRGRIKSGWFAGEVDEHGRSTFGGVELDFHYTLS